MSADQVTTVLVAAIGAAGLVLAGVMPVLVSTRRSAKKAIAAGVAAKEAVTNGHPEHIRDSLDRGFAEIAEKVEGVRKELASDIRGMRRDFGRIGDRVDTVERRVHDLEQQKKSGAA